MKQIKKILYSLILTSFIALSSVTVFADEIPPTATAPPPAEASGSESEANTAADTCLKLLENFSEKKNSATHYSSKVNYTTNEAYVEGVFGVVWEEPISSVAQKHFGNSGCCVSGC